MLLRAVTDVTRVYAMYLNQYDDAETRYKDEYGKIKLDEVLENGMTVSRVRHDAESRRRFETRTLGAVSLGVDTYVNDWTIDSQVSGVMLKKMIQIMLTLLLETT